MDNNKLQSFRLDDALVTPSRNEIEYNARVISLQPKVMEVLHYLARHHNRVISKDELIRNLWRGRVVTDGSVQKSMNLLRKSLAEALGRTDLIAHYSKKGYQLQVQPVFMDTGETDATSDARTLRSLFGRVAYHKYVMAALILVASGLTASYLLNNRHLLYGQNPRTQFSFIVGYTSEQGHERMAEPHPDGNHVVFIRETSGPESSAGGISALVIRDKNGEDWQVASSQGAWVDLAWSANGDSLVAVEIPQENKGLSRTAIYAKPVALYDIHVFTLDLDSNRVLEKHRLGNWQGRISSVTWWDESTIELIAKQGVASSNRRYRYELQSQRLNIVPALDYVPNPVSSKVNNGRTLFASQHNGGTKLDFVASDQTLLRSVKLEDSALDASWLPKGRGALVYSRTGGWLSIVYLDGTMVDIAMPYISGTALSRPRYSANGKFIYFTGEKPRSDLWQHTSSHKDINVTQNDYLNYLATFSPSGKQIAYVSIRNHQHQIWIAGSGENDEHETAEFQIVPGSSDERLSSLAWSDHGKQLIYSTGGRVYVYDFPTNASAQLLHVNADVMPLAYTPSKNELLFIKNLAEANNLWRVNLKTGEQKQLTFGSVATAFHYQSKIYFQYVGQDGLWVLLPDTEDLRLAREDFPAGSNILRIDETGLFYATGGSCRQSAILHTDFESSPAKVILALGHNDVSTSSFHPEQGALYSHCQLPESDILMLK